MGEHAALDGPHVQRSRRFCYGHFPYNAYFEVLTRYKCRVELTPKENVPQQSCINKPQQPQLGCIQTGCMRHTLQCICTLSQIYIRGETISLKDRLIATTCILSFFYRGIRGTIRKQTTTNTYGGIIDEERSFIIPAHLSLPPQFLYILPLLANGTPFLPPSCGNRRHIVCKVTRL